MESIQRRILREIDEELDNPPEDRLCTRCCDYREVCIAFRILWGITPCEVKEVEP